MNLGRTEWESNVECIFIICKLPFVERYEGCSSEKVRNDIVGIIEVFIQK